jgi:GntR family transcriptional regulator
MSTRGNIHLRLDSRSGVAAYLQVVRQVRRAIRLGCVLPGDQLPTVREVVSRLMINPNTVLKAYRELEREGLISSRPGTGTFVRDGLRLVPAATQDGLVSALAKWVRGAQYAGLDRDQIEALFESAIANLEYDLPAL